VTWDPASYFNSVNTTTGNQILILVTDEYNNNSIKLSQRLPSDKAYRQALTIRIQQR
jgi:hypothetical protein